MKIELDIAIYYSRVETKASASELRKKKIQNWHTLKISLLVRIALFSQPSEGKPMRVGKNTLAIYEGIMGTLIADTDRKKYM